MKTIARPALRHIKSIDKNTGETTTESCWKNSSVYSIFENCDPDLKKKIVSFPLSDTFEEWHRTEWKIDKYEGNEVRCVSGKNVKYFTKEEVEEYLNQKRNDAIIQEFDPISSFFEQFGHVHCVERNSFEGGSSLVVKSLKGGFLPGHEGGLKEMGYVNEVERSLVVNDNGRIELKIRDGGMLVFLGFDNNGNFTNRDYNVELQRFSQESPRLEEFFEKMKKTVKRLGELEYSSKTKAFYSQTHCYVPSFRKELVEGRQDPYEMEFSLEAVPKRDGKDDYQQWSGYPIYKKPKVTESLSPTKVWQILEENYLGEILQSFAE